MSLSLEQDVTCPCGETFEAKIWSAVNAEELPELKEEILAGQLNVVKCPRCGQIVYAERFVLYHDPAVELMVFVYPKDCDSEAQSWREKTDNDFRAAQDSLEPGKRLRYSPMTAFGLDALVDLLKREQDFMDEEAVVESMAATASFDLWRLYPSFARQNEVPSILPVERNPGNSLEERLKGGLSLLLSANDRLTAYAGLSARLSKNEVKAATLLDEKGALRKP